MMVAPRAALAQAVGSCHNKIQQGNGGHTRSYRNHYDPGVGNTALVSRQSRPTEHGEKSDHVANGKELRSIAMAVIPGSVDIAIGTANEKGTGLGLIRILFTSNVVSQPKLVVSFK